MEVSGKLDAQSTLRHEKTTRNESDWMLGGLQERVWMLWRQKKVSWFYQKSNPDSSVVYPDA
jgi:hypothetical protein